MKKYGITESLYHAEGPANVLPHACGAGLSPHDSSELLHTWTVVFDQLADATGAPISSTTPVSRRLQMPVQWDGVNCGPHSVAAADYVLNRYLRLGEVPTHKSERHVACTLSHCFPAACICMHNTSCEPIAWR